MILSDRLIRQAVNEKCIGIEPYRDENVQPSSYDLTLGSEFLSVVGNEPLDLTQDNVSRFEKALVSSGEKKGDSLILPAGGFLLGSTEETIRLSETVCGEVHARSSLARYGVCVNLSSYVNPGYEGSLPLAIVNLCPVPVVLRAGLRVCQIVFHYVSGVEDDYSKRIGTKYSGESGPTVSRLHKDPESMSWVDIQKRISEMARENARRGVKK